MRSPIHAIRALLANGAELNLLGISLQEMHYLEQDQDGAYPNLVIYPVSSFWSETMAGMTYPIATRFSVECRAVSGEEAHSVGEAVIAALNNISYQRVLGGEFLIQECRMVGDVAALEEDSDVYRRILDFRMHYSP